VCYASCDKSKEISWSAKRGINEMCSSAWKWGRFWISS
jgi:UDP-glucose 4-epimerase